MRRVLDLTLSLSLTLTCGGTIGCGSGATPIDAGEGDLGFGDLGIDSGPPPICADTHVTFAVPTPAWQTGAMLAAPAGDAAFAALSAAEPTWADQLAQLDGWPVRPTFVIPLDGPATSVDASLIEVRSATGGTSTTTFDARIAGADMRTLVLESRAGRTLTTPDLVLVIRRGAIRGAHALPACALGSTTMPDPAYATARAALSDAADLELVLPYRQASTWEWLPAVDAAYTTAGASPLAVDTVAAATLASFGAAAPDAATAAALADPVASGVLSLPEYRGPTGVAYTSTGDPMTFGTTHPAFIVALPAVGTAPYPYVLYQHGGGQSPTDIFALAKRLADAGFAFVAIDLPEHGNRAPAGMMGSDTSFLDFGDPIRTRGNFQQTVADHLGVLYGIDALNAALAPVLSVPVALDSSHAFVMGMSIGGISTSITFSVGRNVRGTASFVGGAGYPEIVIGGLFGAFLMPITRRPEPERSALLSLGEALLDGADPFAYAQRAEDRTASPRPALFVYAIGDPIVPSNASDAWGRAFGAGLALPRVHPVDGMTELTLPAMGNFAWPASIHSATRVLVQAPANDLSGAAKHELLIRQDWAQQLVAGCFTPTLTGGQCVATDTGWAMH